MRAQRGLIVVALALLGLVFTGGAALAQTAPYPPGADAQCDASVVAPGATITCSAGGFAPGVEVTVEVRGNGFTLTLTVTADSEGVASVTFQVPEDANDGRVRVTFEGQDASGDFVRVAATTFRVQAQAAGGGPIPVTGSNVSNGAILAVGVILLGGALVFGARRRRKNEIHAGS